MSFKAKTSTLEQQITFDADDPRHYDINLFNSLVNYETDFKFDKKYFSNISTSSSSSSESNLSELL